MTRLSRPRPVDPGDDLAAFTCSEASLNDWIRHRALRNERGGASRTFVTVDQDTGQVAGYYCLSASLLRSEDATGGLRRNMPDPIPVILIGRLAVDDAYTGAGVGASLLQDAVLKSVQASRLVGARAILVHALSDSARTFYERFGFTLIPASSRALFITMQNAEATLEQVAS